MIKPMHKCAHVWYMDDKCPWCVIERLRDQVTDLQMRNGMQTGEIERLRAVLQKYKYESRLQTFEDRQRFRQEADEALRDNK